MRTLHEIKQTRSKRLSTLAEDYPREHPKIVEAVEEGLINGVRKVKLPDYDNTLNNTHDYWRHYSPLKALIECVEVGPHGEVYVVFVSKRAVNYLLQIWENLTLADKDRIYRDQPERYNKLKKEFEENK